MLRHLIAALFASLLLAGCTTPPKGAGTGKYAAVEIDGFSRSSVRLAISQVCEKQGYKQIAEINDKMTFEKSASTGQSIVWGGLDKGVWERIEVSVTRLSDEDHFLVSLDAYRINNHGDSLLEDSKKMGFAMQSKYQELLENVRKLLAPMPPPAGK
ncbi:MAG: hypothetical protein RIS76_858 [Verrucomicrobiota bacterium]|jgi:hypothetical protein